MASLTILGPSGASQRFELAPVVTLGREGNNNILLSDPLVSRQHAKIEKTDSGSCWLFDLGSRHGTFVNGQRWTTGQLRRGDEITLGSTRLRFEDDTGDPEADLRATTRLVVPSEQQFAPAHTIGDVELLRRDYERLRVAYFVSRAIGVEHELSALLDRILEAAFEVLAADRGAIVLVDLETGLPTRELSRDRHGAPDELTASTTLMNEVISQKSSIILADALTDARYGRLGSIVSQGICSAMYVPLIHHDLLLGVMHLESLAQPNIFTEKDRDLFTTIANQAALAIRAATLRERMDEANRQENVRREGERQRLERIIRDLPSGVILLDHENRLQLANREAEQILPLFTKAQPGEVLEHLGLYPVEDIPERSGTGVLEIVIPGPRRRTFLVAAARSFDQHDGTETVIVMRETTAEREREQSAARGERMALVGQLAGGIAHDFNNLLSVILNYSEFLAAELKGTPLEEDVELVRQAGQRAGALTRQLLAFSRREIVMPMVLDLNRVVGGLEMLLRRSLGEDVELVFQLAPGLHNVKVDPGRIEQVLMNLAVNARDAMDGGGKLTISTANVEPETIEAGAEAAAAMGGDPLKPGSYVTLAVSDTGHGMSPEVARRIFEPFFTTKDAGRGTGLGLATVHGIVAQAGGGIRVESTVGVGTTFRAFIPVTGESATSVERAQRAGSQQPADGSKRILVTEDESGVRRLTVRVLRAAGFDVVEAASGAEALRIAKEFAPIAVLVTDVVMPRMSGQSLAQRMREETPNLPVIFISGYSDAVDRCQAIAGASVLQKPFTPSELVQRVRESLEVSPSRREASTGGPA